MQENKELTMWMKEFLKIIKINTSNASMSETNEKWCVKIFLYSFPRTSVSLLLPKTFF